MAAGGDVEECGGVCVGKAVKGRVRTVVSIHVRKEDEARVMETHRGNYIEC